jgi:prepilin-type N-terminal cleavage/methylation domain-containing protein
MNDHVQDDRGRQSGYTLLEVMIAIVIMVPLLGTVLGGERLVAHEVSAQNAASSAAEACRSLSARMTSLIRSGYLSTCQTQATQADVTAATLAKQTNPSVVVPDLGDWIDMPTGQVRGSLSFQSADGVLNLNADTMTAARQLVWEMEASETDNDDDDDGDGLVDEGTLSWLQGTALLQVASGIELCTFRIDGRTVTITLRIARRDSQGRVFRSSVTQRTYLRNN